MSKTHMLVYGLLLVLVAPIIVRWARNQSSFYRNVTA